MPHKSKNVHEISLEFVTSNDDEDSVIWDSFLHRPPLHESSRIDDLRTSTLCGRNKTPNTSTSPNNRLTSTSVPPEVSVFPSPPLTFLQQLGEQTLPQHLPSYFQAPYVPPPPASPLRSMVVRRQPYFPISDPKVSQSFADSFHVNPDPSFLHKTSEERSFYVPAPQIQRQSASQTIATDNASSTRSAQFDEYVQSPVNCISHSSSAPQRRIYNPAVPVSPPLANKQQQAYANRFLNVPQSQVIRTTPAASIVEYNAPTSLPENVQAAARNVIAGRSFKTIAPATQGYRDPSSTHLTVPQSQGFQSYPAANASFKSFHNNTPSVYVNNVPIPFPDQVLAAAQNVIGNRSFKTIAPATQGYRDPSSLHLTVPQLQVFPSYPPAANASFTSFHNDTPSVCVNNVPIPFPDQVQAAAQNVIGNRSFKTIAPLSQDHRDPSSGQYWSQAAVAGRSLHLPVPQCQVFPPSPKANASFKSFYDNTPSVTVNNVSTPFPTSQGSQAPRYQTAADEKSSQLPAPQIQVFKAPRSVQHLSIPNHLSYVGFQPGGASSEIKRNFGPTAYERQAEITIPSRTPSTMEKQSSLNMSQSNAIVGTAAPVATLGSPVEEHAAVNESSSSSSSADEDNCDCDTQNATYNDSKLEPTEHSRKESNEIDRTYIEDGCIVKEHIKEKYFMDETIKNYRSVKKIKRTKRKLN